MLAQARCLPRAIKSHAAGGDAEWSSLRYSCATFRGKTVLIFGYGAIGRRLAELLQPLGVTVIGYRRKPHGDETIRMISQSQLGDALATADHVVNILPDSAETRHFFDAKRFEQMKLGAVFYNIGRGVTVDQDALLHVLRSKRLAAAWLDVTDPEPLPDGHPLWSEPNCFITPHIAGGHFEESKALVRHFLGNLQRFVKGEQLVDRVM
jgi:phosphoglycerate dehydrogenase-like enzyme